MRPGAPLPPGLIENDAPGPWLVHRSGASFVRFLCAPSSARLARVSGQELGLAVGHTDATRQRVEEHMRDVRWPLDRVALAMCDRRNLPKCHFVGVGACRDSDDLYWAPRVVVLAQAREQHAQRHVVRCGLRAGPEQDEGIHMASLVM